jgi:hypothetical protein
MLNKDALLERINNGLAINRDRSLDIDENDRSFVIPVPVHAGKPGKQFENAPVPTPKKTKLYFIVQQSFSAKETDF